LCGTFFLYRYADTFLEGTQIYRTKVFALTTK
jgi:hypothetical protein